MNGFEINKIVASIIFGVLLVFGVGKITDWLFFVEKPSQPSYIVEAPVAKVLNSSSGSGAVDIAKLLSMGTVEHGEWQSKMNEIIGQADLIIGKQRHGPTGNVKVEFEGIYTRFKNATKSG